MEKRILYNSRLDYDTIREELEELQREELKEEYREKKGELKKNLSFIGDDGKIERAIETFLGTENSFVQNKLHVSDSKVWNEYNNQAIMMRDDFLLYLENNKNIGELVVFGTNGTWQGRKRFVTALRDIERILDLPFDDAEVYTEDGDLNASFSHHDGTHYYTYRKFKEGIKEKEQKKALEEYLFEGKTSLLDAVTVKIGDKFN